MLGSLWSISLSLSLNNQLLRLQSSPQHRVSLPNQFVQFFFSVVALMLLLSSLTSPSQVPDRAEKYVKATQYPFQIEKLSSVDCLKYKKAKQKETKEKSQYMRTAAMV